MPKDRSIPDYKYPMGLDWTPGSRLASRITEAVMNRAKASKTEMSKREPVWTAIREKLTCYVAPQKLKSADRALLDGESDAPITVVVPISYAILDTILTYWLSAYTDGHIFRYDPVGPEDKAKAYLLEHVVNMQAVKSKMLLSLYVQWRDALAYGLGITSLRWDTRYGRKTSIEEVPIGMDFATGFPTSETRTYSERVMQWEGSVLDNIAPWNYFPDPTKPCHKVQDCEFVGFLSSVSRMELLQREAADNDMYFNIRYLEPRQGRMTLHETESAVDNLVHPADVDISSAHSSDSVDVLSFYWTLVPAEHGLGRSRYPEKWLFEIAGSSNTIIRAQPINLNHNMYPIAVCAPTFDGYAAAPVSLLEVIYEMQGAIDWLWRSRVRSVNATSTPKMLLDPFLARYDQALDSTSNVICMREHVWGRGVLNAMQQVNFQDVTPGHINDIGVLTDIIQRVTGAVDTVQGVVRPTGERRSATEMRDARLSAISRLQKGTRLGSVQSLQDIGLMMGYHTQQFMSRSTYVHLTGEAYRDLSVLYGSAYAPVTPEDVQMEFDVTAADAVTPGGESVQDLIQLFQLSASHPVTAQAFNPVKQVLDIYMQAGVKGAYNFLVMPDDQVPEAAAAQGASPVNLTPEGYI